MKKKTDPVGLFLFFCFCVALRCCFLCFGFVFVLFSHFAFSVSLFYCLRCLCLLCLCLRCLCLGFSLNFTVLVFGGGGRRATSSMSSSLSGAVSGSVSGAVSSLSSLSSADAYHENSVFVLS
jgi:hypothetical protein